MATSAKPRATKNRKPQDWIGLKFNRLTVREMVGREGPRNTLICMAVCECGKDIRVKVTALSENQTRSCGCLRTEINALPTELRPKSHKHDKRSHEAKRASQLRWITKNPHKVAVAARRFRQRHAEKIKVEKAAFYQANRDRIVEKQVARYATDEHFRLEMLLRGRIIKAIQLQGSRKSIKTMELVGCTIEHLMKHLESKFQSGMSWKNRREWHIDHEVPCSSFDLTDESQQRICFHWSNLQPLWKAQNLSKSDSLDWKPTSSPDSDTPAPATPRPPEAY